MSHISEKLTTLTVKMPAYHVRVLAPVPNSRFAIADPNRRQ